MEKQKLRDRQTNSQNRVQKRLVMNSVVVIMKVAGLEGHGAYTP